MARGAEELVCVLVLRGSCEKKERRRRDRIVEIVFSVPPPLTPAHHSVPGSVCELQRCYLKLYIAWLSGNVLVTNLRVVVCSWLGDMTPPFV